MRYTALTLVALVAAAAATGAGLQASLSLLGENAPTVQPPLNLDGDGDNIPDTVEAQICDRGASAAVIKATGVGSCKNSNYTPPQATVTTIQLPSAVILGEDKDGDDLPSYVAISRNTLTINPFSNPPVVLTPTTMTQVQVDRDDDNPEMPAPSTVKITQALPGTVELGTDADKDGLPEDVTIKLVFLEVDRRLGTPVVSFSASHGMTIPVDTDDNDAGSPVVEQVELFIPTTASHTGDGDKDLLPGALTFNALLLTIDRTKATNTETAMDDIISWKKGTKTIEIDPDDSDRNDVIPFKMFDGDADLIPDAAEPVICLVQDKNDPTDGVCIRADGTGSDGSGDNYVPPVIGGILDLVYDPDTIGDAYGVVPSDTSVTEHDAPGLGLLATLALLGGVVIARRR